MRDLSDVVVFVNELLSPVRNPGRGGCIPGCSWTSGSKTHPHGGTFVMRCVGTEVYDPLRKDDTAQIRIVQG